MKIPSTVNHNQMPTVRLLSDICLGSGNNAHFVFTLSYVGIDENLKSISEDEIRFNVFAM